MTTSDDMGGAINPCRRRILSGLTALIADANIPARAHASARGPHDETILYFKRRFDAAAMAIATCSGRRQLMLFRGMSAYAAAMALTPAHRENCISAKREVAEWTLTEGGQTLSLPEGLVRDLVASARHDENRATLR